MEAVAMSPSSVSSHTHTHDDHDSASVTEGMSLQEGLLFSDTLKVLVTSIPLFLPTQRYIFPPTYYHSPILFFVLVVAVDLAHALAEETRLITACRRSHQKQKQNAMLCPISLCALLSMSITRFCPQLGLSV
jgi:hypothetical protein